MFREWHWNVLHHVIRQEHREAQALHRGCNCVMMAEMQFRPFAGKGFTNEVALTETPKSQVCKGLFRPKMEEFPTKGFVL